MILFNKEALVQFNGVHVTDHNRSAFPNSPEFIKNDQRTATGKLRRDFIAIKNSYDMSWEDLPWFDDETVDGNMGAQSLINFITSNTGTFTLTVTNKDETETSYTVMFESFDWELTKRWGTDFYNISVSLVEV